jgi:predicted esterase
MSERKTPVIVPALQQAEDPTRRAVVIFMHGLGDEGASFEGVIYLRLLLPH